MTSKAKPSDSPWLVPYFVVKDADMALDFYTRAFGFAKRFAKPGPDGRTAHAEMTYQDMLLMFAPEGAYGSPVKCPATLGITSPFTLFIYCDDVDALCKRAEGAGARVMHPPADQFWGDRTCTLLDPDGYTWSFATHTGKTFEYKPEQMCSAT
jgi:uncharacterized glyoxalase superfamily protein PhnB